MIISRLHSSLVVLGLWALPRIAMATDSGSLEAVPLGAVAAQLYTYALTLVGLAVFIMFVLAGLAKMIPALQSAIGASPTQIIKDAIIGLIILASAFVILNSISPDLVKTQVQ